MVNYTEPDPETGKLPENVVKAVTDQGKVLKKFTITDVETVLGVLALNGGNRTRTAEQVREEFGIDIHPYTIKNWELTLFPQRYARIQEELSDDINSKVKGRVGDLALRGTELQSRLYKRLDERLDREDSIPVKDLAPTLRNVAQSTDITLKQKQLLENKPTHITEVRTIEQTIKELEDEDIILDPSDIEDITP
jgi:hypothetical protein